MKAVFSKATATHLLALAAGVSLAMAGWFPRKTPQADPPAAPATSGQASPSPMGSARPAVDLATRVTTGVRPDFAAAWAALAGLSPAAAADPRRRLLRDWIADDPDAALEAMVGLDDLAATGLLDLFGPLLEENPDWFLGPLKSHRHGLRGVALRDWWAENLAARDPARLVGLARGFGPLDGDFLMARAMAAAIKDQTSLDEVFAGLQKMPEGPATSRLWKAAGKGLSGLGAEALERYFIEANHPDAKNLFGQGLARALADRRVSPERCAEILGRIPADRQVELAMDLAREAGRNTPAVTAAIDAVLTTSAWPEHAKRLAIQLHNSLPNGEEAVRLVDWAATLPARRDTEDLYRTAIRPFLQQRPAPQVREWIESMPRGSRRDNTLAAWVQAASSFQRLEDARWALSRIDSMHFRTAAQGWLAEAEEKAK